jgi:esterase/lipase superfamily enzyme
MTNGVRTGSSRRNGSINIRSLETVCSVPSYVTGPTIRWIVSNARGQSSSAPRRSPIKWLLTSSTLPQHRPDVHDGRVKTIDRWFSDRLEQELTVARWGHFGIPVLVFPTAGGDAEEIERHKLVDACSELIGAGRVKIYSCDSVAGRAMASGTGSPEHRMWLLNQFHHAVRHEVVPDVGGPAQRIVTAGASIGAFNAVALLCRFPDAFEAAIGMSGTYRLRRFLEGAWSEDLYFSSPVDFLPGLEGDHLQMLQQRRVILASGEGANEDIGESWAVAEVLGAKGVPNRVDSWGPETIHDWPTWWRMLPQYLDEVCS